MKKYEDNKNKIKHNKSKQDEFDEDLNFIVQNSGNNLSNGE